MYQEKIEQLLQILMEDLNILLKKTSCDKEFFNILRRVLSIYVEISEEEALWKWQTVSENLTLGKEFLEKILDAIDKQVSVQELLDKVYEFGKNVEELYNYVRVDEKYYIMVYEINEKTLKYLQCLDLTKAYIIAFVVKNKKQEQIEYMGIPIIALSELRNYEYDAILCCEALPELDNYSYEKVLDINVYMKTYVMGGYELAYERMNFYRDRGPYDGIVTGLSYIRQGIDLHTIKGHFLNFAIGGQDLFYSYAMFRYAYEHMVSPELVKYAIIGVAPYIFEYDMSKTAYNGSVCQRYYSFLGKMNHFSQQWLYKAAYHHIKDSLSCIMKENFEDIYTTTEEEFFLNYERTLRSMVYDSSKLDEKGEKIEETNIKKEYHKNYPETVEFNKKVLEEYLQYLEERNIKPILVMPPMARIYKKYMSWEMYKDVMNVLCNLQERFEFIIVDLLKELELEDCYFRNSSHLNGKGAVKVTELLNKYLK